MMKHKDAVPPSSEKRGFTGQKPENRGKGFHVKRVVVFLAVAFVLTWAYEFVVVYPLAAGALAGLPAGLTQLAVGGAMFFPALAVVVARLVTREGFKNAVLKPRRFKQAFPWFAVAWLGPSVLVALGAGVYFLCFPGDFSPGMDYVVAATQQALAAQGAPAIDPDLLRISQCATLVVGVLLGGIVNIVPAFGEEWGWRGYLVPKVASHLRIVPTLLVTGVVWGLWHAPLTALGHNYGMGYPGWPFAGIAAMCLFCIVTGIFLAYVTERTGSCLAAAVGHSTINAMAQAGIIFSATGGNPFVGPGPTGIVGGCAFVVVAALMLWDLHRREKAGTLRMPQAGLPDVTTKADLARGATTPAIPPQR